MKKLLSLCIGAALLCFLAGCNKAKEPSPEIIPDSASAAYFNSGVDVPASGQEFSVKFSSSLAWEATSDVKWMTVSPGSDEGGEVSVTVKADSNPDLAKRSGHVFFTSGDVSKSVEVRQAAREKVVVQSVTIDGDKEITLAEKASVKLTYTIKPKGADWKTASWSSSSPENATVSQEGLVTAVKEGSAVITIDVDGKTDQVTVTIPHTHVAVTSVTLNKESLSLEATVGSFLLEATVLPENADYDGVVWSVSPEGIASVENGLVKALKEGVAVVTATAGEGSATCTVTVTPYQNNAGEDLNDPIDIKPW